MNSPLHPGEMVDVPATVTDGKTGKKFASTTPAKVIMARLPDKTLLDFGDWIETVSNENIIPRGCSRPFPRLRRSAEARLYLPRHGEPPRARMERRSAKILG